MLGHRHVFGQSITLFNITITPHRFTDEDSNYRVLSPQSYNEYYRYMDLISTSGRRDALVATLGATPTRSVHMLRPFRTGPVTIAFVPN